MLEGYPQKPKRTTRFLPPAYLQALGHIAVYWAYLESMTEMTIWAFLKLDYPTGSAVTTHMGMVSRLQLLAILSELHLLHEPPAIRSHVQEIFQMIEDCRQRRNDYIHAMWKHTPAKKASHIERLKRTAKGKLKSDTKSVTLSDLRDLTIDIDWLIMGLQVFVEMVFPDAYMPWPDRPDKQGHGKTAR